MSVQKIVLKGTSKISLHERFTQLRFDQKASAASTASTSPNGYSHQPTIKRGGAPARSYHPHASNSARSQDSSYHLPNFSPPPLRLPSPDNLAPRYRYSSGSTAARATKGHPIGSYDRYGSRRSGSLSPSPRPSARSNYTRPRALASYAVPAVRSSSNYVGATSAARIAAAKIKKKSIHQRLGVRPARYSTPWQPYNVRNRMARSNSLQSLSRWSSQGSLNSGYNNFNNQFRRRWNSGFRRGSWRRGGGYGNGFQKGGRWRFGGNNNNYSGGLGGWRRRGGWGRGRGRRGGRSQGPPVTKEELDNELDAYMSGTKGVLDQQLDDYMASKA